MKFHRSPQHLCSAAAASATCFVAAGPSAAVTLSFPDVTVDATLGFSDDLTTFDANSVSTGDVVDTSTGEVFSSFVANFTYSVADGDSFASDLLARVNTPDGGFGLDFTSRIPGTASSSATQTVSISDTFSTPVSSGGTYSLDFSSFDFFDSSAINLTNITLELLTAAVPTLADLSLGTLAFEVPTTGDTTNSTDDVADTAGSSLTGSGAPDDVYTIDWAGGDLRITLDDGTGTGDLDLYLFDSMEAFVESAETGSDPEVLDLVGLAAGTYFVVIEGFQGGAGPYTITTSLVPEPGVLMLAGLGGLSLLSRRGRGRA